MKEEGRPAVGQIRELRNALVRDWTHTTRVTFRTEEVNPTCGSMVNESRRVQTLRAESTQEPAPGPSRAARTMQAPASAPRLRWSFQAPSCAFGWEKKREKPRSTCLSGRVSCTGVTSGSRCLRKKNSSQHGPYLVATFRARAVTRIRKISETSGYDLIASHEDPSKIINAI